MPRPTTVEDEVPSPVEVQRENRCYPSPPAPPVAMPANATTPKEMISSPSVAEIQRGFEDRLLGRTPSSFTRLSHPTSSACDIPINQCTAACDKRFAELASRLKHALAPPVKSATLNALAEPPLQPGRNTGHHAICDGCGIVRKISNRIPKSKAY